MDLYVKGLFAQSYVCYNSVMNYSEKIKYIRDVLLLTQMELAKELGVAFATVNRWENGHIEPSIRSKRKIEALFAEARNKKEG